MHDLAVTPVPIPILWKTSDVEAKRALSIRRLYIVVGISLVFHFLLFMFMPQRTETGEPPSEATQGPLVVRLTQPTTPTPATEPPVAAKEQPKVAVTPPRTRPTVTPRVMAVEKENPQNPTVPAQPPPTPAKVTDAPSMMAMVEEARARREASESESKRYNAEMRGRENPGGDDAATANLKRNLATLSNRGGTSGVFQILNKGHRSGQFAFRGWTTDANSNFKQVIDVDAGPQGDLELAMVRKMIELIRQHYKGNFNWESHRLGRVVVLSARQEDSAGLEGFLIKEFFGLGS